MNYALLDPIWAGDTVLGEPVCFTEDGRGRPLGGGLLYTPAEPPRVTSHDGAETYEEGRDYVLEGRTLRRTEGSRIPFLPREVYCPPFRGEKEFEWLRLSGGERYMAPLPEVYRWQAAVSYRHEDAWDGPVPGPQLQKLPRTARLLREGGPLRITFYGDSITAGWEASGRDEHVVNMLDLTPFHNRSDRPPYLPAWPELVCAGLRRRWPGAEIVKSNPSAAGAVSAWGLEHAEELVAPLDPDLVVAAFGMNNLQISGETCLRETQGIIDAVRRACPRSEFLLVAPMEPNREVPGFQNNMLAVHEACLRDISERYPGVGAVPLNALFRHLERRGKDYMELTGNCVNHPNDFSIRIYAQSVLAALEGPQVPAEAGERKERDL